MKGKPFAAEQVEEVRLGAKPQVTQIQPTEAKPEEAKEPAKPIAQTKPDAKPAAKGGSFGLKGGFLLGGGQKKAQPKVEDVTHVKAKSKDESLKIDEVQSAMKSNLEATKEQWINAELFEKIKKSPKLMAAFADPQMNKILQELQTNPQGIMQRYGSHPQFKEVLYEFGTMWREHFSEMAKKQEEEAKRQEQLKKEAEEKIKKEGQWSLLELMKKDV
jgi:hypothetical protein